MGVNILFKVERDPEVKEVESNRRMHEAGDVLRDARVDECSRVLGCIVRSLCVDGKIVSINCIQRRTDGSLDESGSIDGCAQTKYSAAETRVEFLQIVNVMKTESNS